MNKSVRTPLDRLGRLLAASFAAIGVILGGSPSLAQNLENPNNPPKVAITAPKAGEIIYTSDLLTIQGTASDPDGVRNVQIFANGASLATIGVGLTPSWRFPWFAAKPGSYELVAVATDRQGAAAKFEPVSFEVRLSPNGKASIEILSPKDGAEFSAGSDISFTASVVDPKGDIRHLDWFEGNEKIGESDFLLRIATIPGRPIQHRFVWKGAPAGNHKVWARGTDTSGKKVESNVASIKVRGVPAGEQMLVPRGSVWKYNADNKDLSLPASDSRPHWFHLGYDDSGWKNGPGQLGFGDGDEATVVPKTTPSQPTVYFRHTFVGPDTFKPAKLILRLLRDDGAVVYLNGNEILRDNMPPGKFGIGFNTLASSAVSSDAENKYTTYTIDGAVLPNGFNRQNQLAVEVHQASLESGDLGFDLELSYLLAGNDDLPLVSITPFPDETTEPAPNIRVQPAGFHISRSGSTAQPLAVWVEFSGSAVYGKDYEKIEQWVTLPAGRTAEVIEVRAIDDDLVEGDESVIAKLGDPPIFAPLKYRPNPNQSEAKVVIHDSDRPNKPATITILSPKEKEQFVLGAPIMITAEAIDPASYIPSVEFYAGERKIGESNITFIRAPDPGTPIKHAFDWTNAPVGEHVLNVRGKTSAGQQVFSQKVPISVVERAGVPVVGIAATQPNTTEAGPLILIRPGEFQLTRTGDPKAELTVFLKYGGTATPAKDYRELPGSVTFRAGSRTAELIVVGLPDDLVEDVESVVAALLPDPTLGPITRYLVDPKAAEAKVTIQDEDSFGQKASLVITEPKDGHIMPIGSKVTIKARAIDPKGYISSVQFYSSDDKIGESNINFVRAPDPGTPIDHEFTWTPTIVSKHIISARAKTSGGQEVRSQGIVVAVTDNGQGNNVVVLEIVTSDGTAKELGADGKPDPAVFKIRRVGGPANVKVPIFLKFAGSAQNGVDYETLKEEVTLPSGEESLAVVVTPIPDKAVESDETVAISLIAPICPAIFPPPPECYRIKGGSGLAEIEDSPVKDNDPPKVAVTAPKTGASFAKNQPIGIRVEASDSSGGNGRKGIERLDIFIDDKLVQSTKFSALEYAWKDAAPGNHVIIGHAIDDEGMEAKSEPVKITVTNQELSPVKRDLPDNYLPGRAFEVALKAKAPTNGAYTIEEAPPKGWAVTRVSDDGVYDANTGLIKWGPFTSKRDQSLGYRIAPPANATGPGEFAGKVIFADHSLPVDGDKVVQPVSDKHPADSSPADFTMKAEEVSAYASAWILGKTWPTGPNPIPLNYVTHAGKLWRSGEKYKFDPTKGNPPLCWTPEIRVAAQTEAAAVLAAPAARVMPREVAPGQSVEVALALIPPPLTEVAAVEELIPLGWTVAKISNEGYFDEETHAIRWGLFMGEIPRELRYTVTAPSTTEPEQAEFSGFVAFDGDRVEITGVTVVNAPRETPAAQLTEPKRLADGQTRLVIQGPIGCECALEASDNLIDWTPLLTAPLADGRLEYLDPAAAGQPRRFYRLRESTGD